MTLYEVMSFIGSIMNDIFNGMDTVTVEAGITLLDLFCAMLFFFITMDFIFAILGFSIGEEASNNRKTVIRNERQAERMRLRR